MFVGPAARTVKCLYGCIELNVSTHKSFNTMTLSESSRNSDKASNGEQSHGWLILQVETCCIWLHVHSCSTHAHVLKRAHASACALI